MYLKQLSISFKKKKDLIQLCNKRVILVIYHPNYINLPSLEGKKATQIIINQSTDEAED